MGDNDCRCPGQPQCGPLRDPRWVRRKTSRATPTRPTRGNLRCSRFDASAPRHGCRLDRQVGVTPRRTRPEPGSGNRRCRPEQRLNECMENVPPAKCARRRADGSAALRRPPGVAWNHGTSIPRFSRLDKSETGDRRDTNRFPGNPVTSPDTLPAEGPRRPRSRSARDRQAPRRSGSLPPESSKPLRPST
jgi:hypothetical protein